MFKKGKTMQVLKFLHTETSQSVSGGGGGGEEGIHSIIQFLF